MPAGQCRERPLIRWYRTTGDLTPMSITRVPSPISTREGVNMVREHLTPVALDQQLCVPYRASRTQQRTFILSKTGRDFSEDDLALTRRSRSWRWSPANTTF